MELEKLTIERLRTMRESEDHVEFKRALQGNMSYNGGDKTNPKDRRKCILGYVVALCNECGGYLVLGMEDKVPHTVVGTQQNLNQTGKLESDIYKDLGIRPYIYELFDVENKRVLVIQVPSRPKGKVYTFEDVPLMRVGEELLPMDQKKLLSILQEQEPDFSEKFCEGVTISDLDPHAIQILKEKYATKQQNKTFTSLSDRQALSDLHLISGDKVTNAALLLVGKTEVLQARYPQAKVMLEYRNTESQIRFDKRDVFDQPFYILIDELWKAIDARNGNVPVQEGPYIFDIPFFNKEVIREVVNNAFAHRNYSLNSEIVIKQYPSKIEVVSPGGFPAGVTLENMLTVSSTPRNRLLADVLSKTGVVERSGQGLDLIFRITLSEGKARPDYSHTDDFFVSAVLSATVQDSAFAVFIQEMQQELPEDKKITVFDVITLCDIRSGEKPRDKTVANKLMSLGFLEKKGKTNAIRYILSRRYYELTGNLSDYSNLIDWDADQVWAVLSSYLLKYGAAKKPDINKIIGDRLSAKQLRVILNDFKEKGMIKTEGERNLMVYSLSEQYLKGQTVLQKALAIGLNQLKKDGEI